jgi:glucosamine--fructose-6-phosphate aminotransferase (isomerizing)
VTIDYDEDKKPIFKTTKFASTDRFGGDCIKRMSVQGAKTHNHNIGIGHTRWATHGDKTDINAHPHFDEKRRISLVHNGIIGNYHELRKELVEKWKITPLSDTDTEVVALLIGVELDKGSNLFESISAATEKLEGAYSFVLISILEPDNMYVFKNTGTMVIGISEGLQAGSHQIIESNAQVASAEESKTEQDDLFDHKKDG